MLLKANVPIRDTFGKVVYRDVIGQEALLSLMTTNEPKEKRAEDIKHFLCEDGMSHVRISLNSEISGTNNFYEMADEKKLKRGIIYLEKKKIPDLGMYFAGSKYVDLFVNWYIKNHMGEKGIESDLRDKMKLLSDSFKKKVWEKRLTIHKNKKIAPFFLDFNKSLIERAINKNDIDNYDLEISSFPTFFYFEGIAALITQLKEFDELMEFKKEAKKFVLESFQIDQIMAERDILMAMVYIYLKRKEKSKYADES